MVFFKQKIQAKLAFYFEKLEPDTTLILTPNKRLSRFISVEYSQYMGGQNAGAFSTLSCMSLTAWYSQLWREMVFSGTEKRLLSPVQEALIWEEIIADKEHASALLNIPSTAKLAADAWRLVSEWDLDRGLAHFGDDNIFNHWSDAYKARCEQYQLLSATELPNTVLNRLNGGTESEQLLDIDNFPNTIYLYGFDDLSPVVKKLFARLQELGVTVEEIDIAETASKVSRYEFQDENHEIESVALWAKNILIGQPNARVGVVAPNLASNRQKVERIFNALFDPSYIFPCEPQHAPGYNMSAGQPLLNVPVVSYALLALKLMTRNFDLNDVSKLILSPFFGVEEELDCRAIADINLRKQGEPEVGFSQIKSQLSKIVGEKGTVLCPDFLSRLKSFEKNSLLFSKIALQPSEWCIKLVDQLKLLNWPGSRTLDTIEYQQVQSWVSALEEFSTLDEITGKISVARALYCLQQVLQSQSFQVKTKSSSLQILGVLEAAGLPFDYLWVMNLDGEAWPPAPSPNPLLPINLQVQCGMPQSSAERERIYSQQIMQRFLHCADQIIYSSAKHQGDKQLAPSPLIEHVALESFDTAREVSLSAQIHQTKLVERYTDTHGARIVKPENVRGGAQILKSQAACPFQAFARYRLMAKDVVEPGVGLSPAEKGNLIHHVMEVVWSVLKNHTAFVSATELQIEQLIADALAQAFSKIKKNRFLGSQLIAIESERIRELVMAWLMLEKQREPFDVALNETSENIKINNLPIRIRYDRVDKFNDGTLFVLDYKTGETTISSWAGDRPDDPQVPLYALANKQRVAAVAFGQISAKGVAIKGIGESEELAPGIKTPAMLSRMELPATWQEIIAHWQLSLENLAAEFLDGDARVMPKNINLTCRYCELQPLCRIHQKDDYENTITNTKTEEG